jgi:hypothetical protein
MKKEKHMFGIKGEEKERGRMEMTRRKQSRIRYEEAES